jgi:hypothetical protein
MCPKAWWDRVSNDITPQKLDARRCLEEIHTFSFATFLIFTLSCIFFVQFYPYAL